MIMPNYMEKLLEGGRVEWKALGDVTLPTSNIRWRDTKGTYRYIDLTSVSREKNTIIETTEISAENAPSRAKKLVVKNDVIFATTRPTQQRLCMITEEFSGEVASTGYCILRAKKDEVLPKWIYHCITSSDFKNYVEENQSGSAYPAISDAKVKEFKIPTPPLKVQEEIVRILDAFTDLTAELISELTARKKQYTYYRDKLLTFEDGEVEWKVLGEVAKIFDSLHQTPRYSDHGLSMIRVTDIKGGFLNLEDTLKVSDEVFSIFTKKYLPQKYDLVMSRVGSYGNVSIVPSDSAVCMGQNTVVIHPLVNGKYLYYILLSNDVQSFIERNVGGGSQKTLSLKSIKEIPIPIVNETEQARIVSLLDKFDALASSITEGLPREIELRQKQYEYYRNMLLSFPKEEVEE